MSAGEMAFIIFLAIIFFWFAYTMTYAESKNVKARIDRLSRDQQRGLPPFWHPNYQNKKKEIEDYLRETGKHWLEPGGIVEVPDPVVQARPDGRIELIQTQLPWRLQVASHAMNGYLASFANVDEFPDDNVIARKSLRWADALIAEYEKSAKAGMVTFEGVGLETIRKG